MWLNEKCNVMLILFTMVLMNRLEIIKCESKMLYAI